MGYETKYYLDTIYGDDEQISKFWDELCDSDENIVYAVGRNGRSGQQCKWYGRKEDMLRISRSYPEIVFELKGYGEESGDIWVEYFKNDKMQHLEARIEFDEYDESGLK